MPPHAHDLRPESVDYARHHKLSGRLQRLAAGGDVEITDTAPLTGEFVEFPSANGENFPASAVATVNLTARKGCPAAGLSIFDDPTMPGNKPTIKTNNARKLARTNYLARGERNPGFLTC